MSAQQVFLRPVPLLWCWRLVHGLALPMEDWHPQYPLAETMLAAALRVQAAALADEAEDATAGHEPTGPTDADWGLHQILVDGLVVGDAVFHGPPAPDPPRMVEIGYAVVPEYRGRGVAGLACGALLERAWAGGAEVVRADVAFDNAASRAVLVRHGFRAIGPAASQTETYLLMRPGWL